VCGFLGLIGAEPHAVERVLALLPRLEHRGPDDSGWLSWSPGELAQDPQAVPRLARVTLAHRRLSILDLSPRGHQPMSSADGRYHLVFNGEVYSYRELRPELEALGHTFTGESDTEVVLAAWAAWGPAALSRFVGMYAFAVLDTERHTLTLARDPFGIKPLYYCRRGREWAFASEIPALLELSDLPRRADPQAALDFLRLGLTDHGERTCFAGVSQVPPASWIEVDLRDGSTRRGVSWTPPLEERRLDYADAVQRVRDAFLRSVELHLRSDVRVGAALSGGIDSSAIVCAIREVQPETELHTFSYVPAPSSGAPSEERWAQSVAEHTGATRHVVSPTAAELAADLDDLIRSQAEPFQTLSLYAQARVFRLARAAGVTVLLDGQGADELLGGYAHYQSARLASLLAQGKLRRAARFARASSRAWGHGPPELLRGARRLLLPEALLRRGRGRGPAWLAGGWFRAQGLTPQPSRPAVQGRRYLQATLRGAVREESLPRLLRFEDRNSMACSLESRVPFLTVELAELCLSLPEDYVIDSDARSKAVFRDAMRGLVPQPILERRDKVGFVASDRDWLLGAEPWVRETLELAEAVPALDAPALARGWRTLQAGGEAPLLWRGLNFARWWHLFGLNP